METVQRPEKYNPTNDPEAKKELKSSAFISHKNIRMKLEAASRKRAEEINA